MGPVSLLFPQTMKASIKKDLHSELEINAQNSDNQTEGVSDDFILADTYFSEH